MVGAAEPLGPSLHDRHVGASSNIAPSDGAAFPRTSALSSSSALPFSRTSAASYQCITYDVSLTDGNRHIDTHLGKYQLKSIEVAVRYNQSIVEDINQGNQATSGTPTSSRYPAHHRGAATHCCPR